MKDHDRCITIIIIILSLIRIAVDISVTYKNCYIKPSVTAILFIHSFIWVFTYLGCLYKDRKMLWTYLITIIVITLHWITNANRCVLTTIVNEQCNLHIDTKYDWLYFTDDGWIAGVAIRTGCILYTLKKLFM